MRAVRASPIGLDQMPFPWFFQDQSLESNDQEFDVNAQETDTRTLRRRGRFYVRRLWCLANVRNLVGRDRVDMMSFYSTTIANPDIDFTLGYSFKTTIAMQRTSINLFLCDLKLSLGRLETREAPCYL